MFDQDIIEEVANDVWGEGRALVRDNDGRRLLLTSTSYLQLPGEEIILAYEGRGVIFFQLDRPMNRYRLLSRGFPEKVVDDVSDMVNGVIHVLAQKRQVEAAVPALESPEK